MIFGHFPTVGNHRPFDAMSLVSSVRSSLRYDRLSPVVPEEPSRQKWRQLDKSGQRNNSTQLFSQDRAQQRTPDIEDFKFCESTGP